ncbi:BPIB4 protein, partial [Bucco capensis]|nr:BPIB4 protein [Bucco capensis]
LKMLKLFGILLFCGLLCPSQEALSGLACAVSPEAMQHVLSDAILQNGLLQQHLHGLVVPSILSDGGLLNSPTIISGLHLVRVRRPKLSVLLLSDVGVQLAISTKLELSGNCLIGLLSELIDILVDVRISANIKCTNFKSGTVQLVIEDCLCIVGAVKVKLLSGLLTLSVNEIVLGQLTATLPSLLCPVLEIVVNLVNIQLIGTLNEVIPMGTAGTIHYQLASLPFTSGLFLGLELDGTVKRVGGSVIPYDSSSSPSVLPPLLEKLLVLVLRQSFLNAVLALLIHIPAHTFPCSPDVFSSALPLQEAIRTLVPADCSACRGSGPLSIRLTLAGDPVLLLEERKASLKLLALLQVSVKRADGAMLSLLLLKADLSLNVHLSIVGGRLLLALSPGSTSLSLESSDVGITDISLLKPHCSTLLLETLLPIVNGALLNGIPLPNILGIAFIGVEIRI